MTITDPGTGYAVGDQITIAGGQIPGIPQDLNLTVQPSNLLTNSVGCDSIATLNLTINNSNTGTSSATACDSYTWDGVTYTTSGTYSNTYTNAAGCDSVHTLNLTINNSNTGTSSVTACDSYTWDGVV